ncbi:MAG: biotin/lipoyl-binding protein [Methanomassiliicoccales archaeon]|nr:MAG: biotin/lipoyl-binding protein [Methanomassiliicoccales archaeon]
MKLDLLIDGKTYVVELAIGKPVIVKLDGETYQVEVEGTKDGMRVVLDDQDFSVRVGESHVTVDGQEHKVEVRNLRRGRPSWYYATEQAGEVELGKPAEKLLRKEGMIHPPMPGRVVSIKVKEGDVVKVGTPILVLEAMKMQNEVVSPVDGEVKEVRTTEGSLVDVGDMLVLIQ